MRIRSRWLKNQSRTAIRESLKGEGKEEDKDRSVRVGASAYEEYSLSRVSHCINEFELGRTRINTRSLNFRVCVSMRWIVKNQSRAAIRENLKGDSERKEEAEKSGKLTKTWY